VETELASLPMPEETWDPIAVLADWPVMMLERSAR
jgi:hypothetical protein